VFQRTLLVVELCRHIPRAKKKRKGATERDLDGIVRLLRLRLIHHRPPHRLSEVVRVLSHQDKKEEDLDEEHQELSQQGQRAWIVAATDPFQGAEKVVVESPQHEKDRHLHDVHFHVRNFIRKHRHDGTSGPLCRVENGVLAPIAKGNFSQVTKIFQEVIRKIAS